MSQPEVVMKAKENVVKKEVPTLQPKVKGRSLRPMRSLVAVRSLKPTTIVATMAKTQTEAQG
jgi:hypothetical protein